jgi:hypothetical protein
LGDASDLSFDKIAKGLFGEFCQCIGGNSPKLLSTVISISFNGNIDMKNLRIYTSDLLSFCFLENVLAKLAQEHKIENFEILCSEADHLADFDAYFLAYQIHVKDFHHEVLHESCYLLLRLGVFLLSCLFDTSSWSMYLACLHWYFKQTFGDWDLKMLN